MNRRLLANPLAIALVAIIGASLAPLFLTPPAPQCACLSTPVRFTKVDSRPVQVRRGARQFNAQGATPTNATRRNILRRESENDWHGLQRIHLLTSLAAMLHDLGKACRAFQERLLPGAPFTRNLYRHEWISLRIFHGLKIFR